MSLRENLIKLANEVPETRQHILPLLRRTASTKTAVQNKTHAGLLMAFRRGRKYVQEHREAWEEEGIEDDKADFANMKAGSLWSAVKESARVMEHYGDRRDFRHSVRLLRDISPELEEAAFWAGQAFELG